MKFLRKESSNALDKVGRYFIMEEGQELMQNYVSGNSSSLYVLDEISKLELAGKGWSDILKDKIKENKQHLLLVVREELTEEILRAYSVIPEKIINIENIKCENAIREVNEILFPES